MSYITGAHAVKVGLTHRSGSQRDTPVRRGAGFMPIQSRCAQSADAAGVSNHAAVRRPRHGRVRAGSLVGPRPHLTAGVRYDYYTNSYPEQQIGPALFAPTRNITIPETLGGRYHDVTPVRSGL